MLPAPRTASNLRSVAMHLTQVAYGGCWKCPQLWQRCNSRTPRLAASQNGFVHSFGTGIGRVTLLQSLIYSFRGLAGAPARASWAAAFRRPAYFGSKLEISVQASTYQAPPPRYCGFQANRVAP